MSFRWDFHKAFYERLLHREIAAVCSATSSPQKIVFKSINMSRKQKVRKREVIFQQLGIQGVKKICRPSAFENLPAYKPFAASSIMYKVFAGFRLQLSQRKKIKISIDTNWLQSQQNVKD